ncbi:MAG TPA: oligosaccharide flippase family protein [Terriglobales bacterium]|nr:oligosaccharide flippase family protein [Terriglobales bacterium]
MPTEALSRETLRGGAFLAARYGLGVLVSLGNMLVLTWWIGPHAYGVFVTAIGLVSFLASVARAGVDTYLVRLENEPDAKTYGIASTVVLSTSIVLTGFGCGLIPLLTRWYGGREFAAPYFVLLLSLPVVGMTGIPTAVLERQLNFQRLAGLELGGQGLGLVLSMMLAWSHCGVWAPVAGQLGWQGFLFLATCASASYFPRFRFAWHEARTMLRYGAGLTASLRTWQLRTLVNPLLVGKFAGAEAVAFVAFAIRTAEALGSVRMAAGRLAIAALARLQNSREQFRASLEQALFLQIITLGPLLCAFALLGSWAVRHIAGPRWMPSLIVYPFVAAGVLVNSLYNLQASALFVVGKQWLVMRSYTAHVVLLAAGTFFLLPRYGIAGYGWAELLACSAYPVLQSGLKTVPISYRRLTPWLAAFTALLFIPMLWVEVP